VVEPREFPDGAKERYKKERQKGWLGRRMPGEENSWKWEITTVRTATRGGWLGGYKGVTWGILRPRDQKQGLLLTNGY